MKIPYALEIVVFISGAVVMMVEFLGSRILAPYVGTSIYIWTSLIGIILASLSLGYWWGGKLADTNPSRKLLSMIITGAALCVGLIAHFHPLVLTLLQDLFGDIRTEAVAAAFILFAPVGVLLGMVSPFAARLKIEDVKNSGTTIGNLSAISTVGSIIGTFITGFFLVSLVGSTNLLFWLAIILLLTALLLTDFKNIPKQLGIGIFLIYIFAVHYFWQTGDRGSIVADVDTDYSRVWIADVADPYSGEPIRVMQINKETSSGMYFDSDELVFPYTRYYRLIEVLKPDFERILMIGGAGYSFPKYALNRYPNAFIDVVEIDPGVTELAYKYFNLLPHPRLHIIHEDGRVFLNQTQDRYDVILGDAFRSYSVPFQLATKEAVTRMYDRLTDEGVVIVNLIGTVEGDKGKFVRAEYATFQAVFPRVYLFPVPGLEEGGAQNIMLVALKSLETPQWQSNDPEIQEYLTHLWTKPVVNDVAVLTDDFAPVEQYSKEIL